MSSHIPESDWRRFRELHRVLLERYCDRVLAELAKVIQSDQGTAHEKYLRAHKLIQKHDDEIARAFDDFRRSTAVMQLGIMRKMRLLTDEDLSAFSQEIQTSVRAWDSF